MPAARRTRRRVIEEEVPEVMDDAPRPHHWFGCLAILIGLGLLGFVVSASDTFRSSSPAASQQAGLREDPRTAAVAPGQSVEAGALPALQKIEQLLKAAVDALRWALAWVFNALSAVLAWVVSLIQRFIQTLGAASGSLQGGT